jgi:hypothetical protein
VTGAVRIGVLDAVGKALPDADERATRRAS